MVHAFVLYYIYELWLLTWRRRSVVYLPWITRSAAHIMVGHRQTGSATYEMWRVSGYTRSLYNKEQICEGERCAHLVYSVLSAPSLASQNELFWQHLKRGRRAFSGRSKASGLDLVICTLDPCRFKPPIRSCDCQLPAAVRCAQRANERILDLMDAKPIQNLCVNIFQFCLMHSGSSIFPSASWPLLAHIYPLTDEKSDELIPF